MQGHNVAAVGNVQNATGKSYKIKIPVQLEDGTSFDLEVFLNHNRLVNNKLVPVTDLVETEAETVRPRREESSERLLTRISTTSSVSTRKTLAVYDPVYGKYSIIKDFPTDMGIPIATGPLGLFETGTRMQDGGRDFYFGSPGNYFAQRFNGFGVNGIK